MPLSGVPFEKLQVFQDKIGLEPGDLDVLRPFQDLFTRRKNEFADYFYDLFCGIPETRLILEHERQAGVLRTMWARWFEYVFSADVDKKFVAYLWRIGVRHVEVNLGQRYSNLGFAVIRQFCQRLILAEVPPDMVGLVTVAVDKLIDLCLLIETDAYIENTTRCDIEVIRGVADRVRNPSLVIGGNIKRLQRNVASGSREYEVYDTVIAENDRLENMFSDIKVYMEAFSAEPEFIVVDLKTVITSVLERMAGSGILDGIEVDLKLDPVMMYVEGDAEGLEHLFYYLIQNAVEAADKLNPYVSISSHVDPALPHDLQITIFNTGTPPDREKIKEFFSPFYSTKRGGSGFGLPIARVIVRKHFGKLVMEPEPGKGTRVTVSLPLPG
jgi:signal transduction histidine kinase